MTITRMFSTEKFRTMCIKHGFCNACSSVEYEAVFRWIDSRRQDASDKNICDLAVMIADLTNIEDFPGETVEERKELIAHIGFTIMQECVSGFIVF